MKNQLEENPSWTERMAARYAPYCHQEIVAFFVGFAIGFRIASPKGWWQVICGIIFGLVGVLIVHDIFHEGYREGRDSLSLSLSHLAEENARLHDRLAEAKNEIRLLKKID